MRQGRREATEHSHHAFSKRHQSSDVNWNLCIIVIPDVQHGPRTRVHSAPLRVLLLRLWSLMGLHGTVVYTDPNSAIQPSYFSRSAAATDLEIFLSVRVKSSMVTGICSSSLDRARISSGLRPWMRRRIAIMDASLTQV